MMFYIRGYGKDDELVEEVKVSEDMAFSGVLELPGCESGELRDSIPLCSSDKVDYFLEPCADPVATAPQPNPTHTDSKAVWPLVYEDPDIPEWLKNDMRERDDVGRARYGTPLQVLNGRDAVVDAYQESLDLVVYTRQAIERRKLHVAGTWLAVEDIDLNNSYINAIEIAIKLGAIVHCINK